MPQRWSVLYVCRKCNLNAPVRRSTSRTGAPSHLNTMPKMMRSTSSCSGMPAPGPLNRLAPAPCSRDKGLAKPAGQEAAQLRVCSYDQPRECYALCVGKEAPKPPAC
jgi:hypothetical protein